MKIAIIGSGVAGLTSAYLLAPQHDVVLYEKDTRIGGHAHTNIIKENGKKIAVDNGFMVFNPKQYPNFIALLKQLEVETTNTKMSFGVQIPKSVDFNGSFPNGIFAKRSNIFNLRYLKFLKEIVRFRKLAKAELQKNPQNTESLGQFLRKHNISTDLADWFLFPMLSAIWSMKETSKISDFPALATFTFLNNHRLLSNTQPQWKTIVGGSIQYVEKIRKSIEENNGKILLSQKIIAITRTEDGVSIKTDSGTRSYDYVLLATHADTSLKLLKDATTVEKAALGMFKFSKNQTVLHKDTSVLPKNKRLVGAWNYTQKSNLDGSRAVFTYSMNILQHIPNATPVLVTLNPTIKIPESMIYHTETYEHPEYTLKSLKGQELIQSIQGENHTLYAGAYLGYGFHEDGVFSAIKAVSKLGVHPTWQK